MRTFALRQLGAVLALALGATLVACGGQSSTDDAAGAGQARLKIGAAAVPASMDPRLNAPYEAIWVALLYDPLIQRNDDGTFKPGLAESWTLSPDAKQLDLKLRSGVTFQDGAPFNADAVKANLDYSLTHPANYANQLKVLKGVEVVSPTQVRLTLGDSGAPMLGVLSGEAGMMISPASLSRTDLATNPAGAGPYKLDKYEGGNFAFTKWDGYWNKDAIKLPGIDATTFIDESARVRALLSGQIDMAFIQPLQVPEIEKSGLKTIFSNTADFWGVIVNTGQAEFDNPKVRQAMTIALDRAAIAKNVFGPGCKPSAQPFRPDDWAYVPGLDDSAAAKYDPARAKQLLAEAGLPDGFSFELQTGTMQATMQLSQILQAQWGAIGLKVNIKPMENVQFVTARREGKFQATVSTYQTSRPDQSQFVKTFYLPGGLFNPAGYDLPGVSQLLVQSSSSQEQAARQVPMRQIITNVLNDGPPVIPICTRATYYAYRNNVHGLTVPPLWDSTLPQVTVDAK